MSDPLGVSLALDAPTLDPDPVWTRIDTLTGCRVRGWSIDRGRPNEFAKTDTGTAVVHIVDRAGLFDPTNASSPYAGKILPGKQAAVALQNPTGAHAWFTLFRGFVEAWSYRLDPTRQYMELELQLVDGFAILSRYELRVGVDGALPPYTGSVDQEKLAEFAKGNVLYGETIGHVSDRILAILGDAGWPPELAEETVDVFTGNVRVGPKSYGPGTSALDALFDAVDAEIPGVANLYMSKDGHVTFHGRQARFRPDVAEYGIQRRTVGDPSAHDVEDVVPLSELEWTASWDNFYNAASATPQGVGSGLEWRQLNPDPPANDNVEGQYVTDDASIAAVGFTSSITFDQLQTIEGLEAGTTSLQETKRFAEYYVENYATPQPRISRMVFKSRHPSDPLAEGLWTHMCRCEISDLLTLKTAHPGGGGFDTDFYVEGIHYTGRPGAPDYPIVELALDVSPRAHYTTNPFPEDTDPT